ncbi:sensor histidine kinase [Limoniibacter endophyticus]|uniref:histidine kinase n=1 Tax=Limoniibacter endophyticus TaxID=1565040 RepID=A0A8J3DLZ7_9HYPH|nr:HAMP domain-containing sensor histidine kinase [Limoniibacter endophyticus]GHC69231.1 two-component sensor histidine kinase [Limoniibacter endophyticus]
MIPRLRALLRTTAFRLSALFLLLFAVSAAFLVFYMMSLSQRMLYDQTQATINEEVRGVVEGYRRGGLPALVRVIERRSRQPGANLYLLADPNGRVLSGNVQAIDPRVLAMEGWTEQPIRYQRYGDQRNAGGEDERPHEAITLTLRMPNQMILLVGRDLGEPQLFNQVIRRSLLVALVTMGLGTLAIWFLVGRRALLRIDNISLASRQIMAGDLSKRLPVTGSGDEFDRLSENLNAMLAKIASLNDGLKQVSDNIAHDLKTPLTRLRNRAEASLAGTKSEDEYRAALEANIAESDQLIRTFNAILMISRLEAGYSAEQVSQIDLADIMRDVVELYEPLAEDAGVKLSGDVSGEFPMQVNRELVGQALSNVVDNAIKYAQGTERVPTVEVSLKREGDVLALSIADNGPGVPDEDDRKRATERFVRLEESRSQPGSGLGLSLAKAVMQFHDGTLELLDNGPGLRVVMRFPMLARKA